MKYYIWIITLLAHVLIVTRLNAERPKRDLAFIKKIIGNLFGYNRNNAIMTNKYNVKIPYSVPNYQFLTNVIPHPYMNRNVYQGSIQKIFLPNNVVMQPLINFGRPNIPLMSAFGERNYKTDYANIESSQYYGNMQRLIPVPRYNQAILPLVPVIPRCDDKIPILYTRQVAKEKAREGFSAFSKQESQKLQEQESFRNTEEKSNKNYIKATSQSNISKNITETLSPLRVPVKKIQPMKTSTISPSSAINVVETTFSSAPTISTTELVQISTSTSPTLTNIQELINSLAVATLTTSPPPLSLPVNNFEKLETTQTITPIISSFKNRDEDIYLKSTTKTPMIIDDYKQLNNEDEINNKFSPKKLLQISTSTPPTFTNIQKLITSHAMSSPLTTSVPPPEVSIKDVEIIKTGQTIIDTTKKTDEEIQSTSTESIPTNISDYKKLDSKDEIDNKINPNNISEKLVEISTITPPTFTNAQELITSQVVTLRSILMIKDVEKIKAVQPIIDTTKKIDEEIQSTSTESIPTIISDYKKLDSKDEIDNKINPNNISEKLVGISAITSPTFTNAQELITSPAVTLRSTLTTSLPPPPLPVTITEKFETVPIIFPLKKKVEENKPTSTTTPTIPADFNQPKNKDEIKNKYKPHIPSKIVVTFTEPIKTRFVYKKVNSNKPNEDTVFKMENIKYPNASESLGDLMAQPSIFNHAIDVLNSIAPIRGKVLNRPNIFIQQDKTYTNESLEERSSDDMEITNQSTDAYPSESEELDYLNSSSIILDDPSYSFVQDGSENESNESDDALKWMMTSDSARDTSRGDVPDV